MKIFFHRGEIKVSTRKKPPDLIIFALQTFAMTRLKTLWDDLLLLFFPSHCLFCGEVLARSEKHYCLACSLLIPKTNFHTAGENSALIRFDGRVKIEKAASFFYYNNGSIGQKIIQEIKYKNNPRLAVEMGRLYGEELKRSGFTADIDLLIPIPLHPSRYRKRGYNQAEQIAVGLSGATAIPYDAAILYRKKANKTQTRKSLWDRWRDTQNIFALRDPELLSDKHVLLIDDVLTTGATLESAAKTLLPGGCKVSILTLSFAE